MADNATHRITQLLGRSAQGDSAARAELMEAVHSQLRQMAAPLFRRERVNHTLQATALVNEIYLKLLSPQVGSPEGPPALSFHDRTHFFAIAARQMRRCLIDHARGHRSAKRGGDAIQLSLEDWDGAGGESAAELLAVDQALEQLEAMDPGAAQIIEMKYFAGMQNSEIAEALGRSEAAVRRETTFALRWLKTKLAANS